MVKRFLEIRDITDTGYPTPVTIANKADTTTVNAALANKADTTTVNAALATKEPLVTAGTTAQYYRGDKTFQTLNKAAVGLGNFNEVNALDYGVVNDGVTINNTAIANLFNSSNKIIYFPAGTYAIGASGININSFNNKIVYGDGMGKTIFKMVAVPTNNMLFFNGGSGFNFRDITFDGNELLTGTGGSYSTNMLPPIYAGGCSNFDFSDVEFKGFRSCGLLLNVCTNFKITKCRFIRATPATYENYGVLVGGAVGAESYNGIITNNKYENCQVSVNARDLVINGNFVSGWGFSAGINTQALSTNRNLVITNNICCNSNQAQDSSPYSPAGIENWAANSVISGNICYGNFGSGIDNGGANCAITGNICYDNSQSGLNMLVQDATYNASGCVVTGNKFYDTRVGVARTQLYGYFEHTDSGGVQRISGVLYANNISTNNINPDIKLSNARYNKWTDVTSFSNGWQNYGPSFSQAGYMLDDDGFVHLKGLIKSGPLNTTIFQLPTNMRPTSDRYIGNNYGRVSINSSGQVMLNYGDVNFTSLDGISFQLIL